MTFEESMAALEKIVKTLEEGEVSIEKSIEEFEKGIHLVKEMQAFLDTAQKQVSELIGDISHAETAD